MMVSSMIAWLGGGVLLFFAEMGLPGIGLMFAGCGALTVGLMLNFAVISPEDFLLQALVFLISTAIWTVCLWKPIQKRRRGKASYSNIIGETAIVSEKGITKNNGEVTWSGSLMKAKLSDNSAVDFLGAGATVVIKEISGNILTVTPK